MQNIARLTLHAVAWMLIALPTAGNADQTLSQAQRVCSARTNTDYGFQCQGYDPSGLPVTFVGTVSGSATGRFEGYGTFGMMGKGSIREHAVGDASFLDETCFGHIQYSIRWVKPDNTEIDPGTPLNTLDIDFTVVDNGREILGTPNAPLAMSCRLVRLH